MGRGRGHKKVLSANPIRMAANMRANHRQKTRERVLDQLYRDTHPSFFMLKMIDRYLYDRLEDLNSYFDPRPELEAYADLIKQHAYNRGRIDRTDHDLLFGLYDYQRFRNFKVFQNTETRSEMINELYPEDKLKEKFTPLANDFNINELAKQYRYGFISEYYLANNLVLASVNEAIKNPDTSQETIEREALSMTVDNNIQRINSCWPKSKNIIAKPDLFTARDLRRAFHNLIYAGNKHEQYEGNRMLFYSGNNIHYINHQRVKDLLKNSPEVFNNLEKLTGLHKADFIEAYNVWVTKEAENEKIK